MTQALKGRKLLLVGFTLFSMFFGAGNLIFPPQIGLADGTQWGWGALGIVLTGVIRADNLAGAQLDLGLVEKHKFLRGQGAANILHAFMRPPNLPVVCLIEKVVAVLA